MFVVRDKDGKLLGFGAQPYKIDDKWCVSVRKGIPIFGFNYDEYIVLDETLFPDLKFEDYPLEVDLIKK